MDFFSPLVIRLHMFHPAYYLNFIAIASYMRKSACSVLRVSIHTHVYQPVRKKRSSLSDNIAFGSQ